MQVAHGSTHHDDGDEHGTGAVNHGIHSSHKRNARARPTPAIGGELRSLMCKAVFKCGMWITNLAGAS
jgi:hypothetical protein